MHKLNIFILSISVPLLVVLFVFFIYPNSFKRVILLNSVRFTQAATVINTQPKTKINYAEHMGTPKEVKAIYMSQCASASQELRNYLLNLVDDTEINSIVVDLKDYTGTVVFDSKVAISGGRGCKNKDFRELIKEMHRRDIYVIGRITVFQDPLYTKAHPEFAVKKKNNTMKVWKDYKGLSFVDVGARPFWDYILQIAREAHSLGVDEINFDYIRYPSDGNMRNIFYEHSDGTHRADELERFLRFLSRKFKVEHEGHVPIISADLFGMTATNYDDLTIGQVLERTTPYFDYVSPMVYPSHYPRGFNGYINPNKNVYGVVKYSMDRAIQRVKATSTKVFAFSHRRISTSTPVVYRKRAMSPLVLRPWLQDFDYGGDYGPKEVRAQIQAVYDAGLTSWMLWSPSNRYTRNALEPNR